MKTIIQLERISDKVYNRAINSFWDNVNLITWQEHNELTELELATVFGMIRENLEQGSNNQVTTESLYNDITI